ncbi:MAG: VTT domain-containing protein [Opitutaceae bacterium]
MSSSPAKVPVGLLVKLGLVALAAIVVVVLLLRGVDVRGQIDRVFAFVREAGPWAFFGSMAVFPSFGFPISPYYLTAGEAFAGQMTMPGVLAAALLANTVQFAFSFWLAHRALRPLLERLLARTSYRVPQVTPENETTVAVLARVTPGPPLFLQSYLLGLSGVRFRTYMLVSVGVQGVMGSAFIVFGKALMSGKGGMALLGLMLLVVALAAVQLLRKRYAKRDAGAA